jgi:RNA polymerase sigma factor (sigma-70 family)
MSTDTAHLLRCVRRIASQAGAEPDDPALLARYLAARDPDAFSALVTRHGPMVWRVCQHVLGNCHDAEDAFQATFLVLARRAAAVRPAGCLAGWLHGVASRVALGARTTALRRGAALTPDCAPPDPRPDPLAEVTARDTLRILEEEVQRLPEAYRLPVTLCCLHGLTQEEAARQLGWTPGSVKGRLERGRKRLQRRLVGRGLGLAAALAVVEVARATAAGPGRKLVAATALAATSAASRNAAGTGLVSAAVLSLARRGLTHVALARGRLALLLLFAAALTAGLAALGRQPRDGAPPRMSSPPEAEPPRPAEAEALKRKQPGLDLHGDPLPDGAVARLGTERMRHAHRISGAVFSHDGKSIIASDYYSGVHVWDLATGKDVRRFYKDDLWCNLLALSPDGRTLAVASNKLGVRLCDPISGRQFGSLPQEPDEITQLVFSNDSSMLATGRWQKKSVCVWDVATQRLLHEVTFDQQPGHVAFSSDGKLLACSTSDGHCRLWDLALSKEVRRLTNEPPGKDSLHAIFAPNGGPMAVLGYQDHSIRLFDASGVKEIRRFKEEATEGHKLTSPSGWLSIVSVTFSPDGKILAVFRETEGRIDLWDVERGNRLRTLASGLSHKPTFLQFSPDGTKLMSAGGNLYSGDNIVRVWDVLGGKEILSPTGHSSGVKSIAISPDGNTVATAGRDGIIHLWERSSGKHLLRLEGYPAWRCHVFFSSDGRRIIWCETHEGDGTLRIWDSRTGQALSRLELEPRSAFWTTVSDDGTTAISTDEKGTKSARFHDLATGKITREIADSASNKPMVLSPSGDKMVCYHGDVINVADRKKLFNIGRVYETNPSIAFSADGRKLMAAVVAEVDLTSGPPADEIVVFDATEGKELRRFGKDPENRCVIDSAALSRDGKTVVAGVRERNKSDGQTTIILWETETGRERGHFLGHRGQTNRIAISADGRFIVTGAEDTTALVWDATRPRTRNAAVARESADLDLAAHFRNLAGNDAERAYVSIRALVDAPKKTTAFLGDQGSLFARADVRAIQRQIQDLDSNEFADRERASEALERILDEAEPHLRKALQGNPSAEARRRIDLLLGEMSTGLNGRELQRFRVIEVLEHIAAPGADTGPEADATRLAALALLKRFAAGAPGARPTEEARASLVRLETGHGIKRGSRTR